MTFLGEEDHPERKASIITKGEKGIFGSGVNTASYLIGARDSCPGVKRPERQVGNTLID